MRDESTRAGHAAGGRRLDLRPGRATGIARTDGRSSRRPPASRGGAGAVRGTCGSRRDEPAATEPAEPSAVRADAQASVPDAPVVPPSAHPAAPLLDQVLRQTLDSVEQLYGGEFQAEHAAFGDLDGDGVQDAAVLITYAAERNEYVQYLVAYLFDGETFQSVATRNVGGRFLDALRAALRGIDDGRILVELEALDRDAACCATRRTAFVLDGGQLVELPAARGRDAGQTSQAGPTPPG